MSFDFRFLIRFLSSFNFFNCSSTSLILSCALVIITVATPIADASPLALNRRSVPCFNKPWAISSDSRASTSFLSISSSRYCNVCLLSDIIFRFSSVRFFSSSSFSFSSSILFFFSDSSF